MTLTLPVSFSVLIESMLVRLYRDGHSPEDPFLELTLPACEIRRSTDVEIDGQTTRILNIAQFSDFIGDFMFNESVILRVCGSAKAHFSGMRSRLQMNDHVVVTGLNNFPGYVIKSCQLLLPKAPDGALLEAVLDLPNPSLATIEMGDLTLDLYIGPVVVGEVFIPNVTFAPGPNIVTSRVYLDTKTAMSNLRMIIQSQKELLRHGKLGVKVSGKSTRRNGENLVYFEKALSKLQLSSQVPLSRVLGNTVGGIATSIAPGNLLTLLRMTGIMAILQGNGLDLAQLTQLD